MSPNGRKNSNTNAEIPISNRRLSEIRNRLSRFVVLRTTIGIYENVCSQCRFSGSEDKSGHNIITNRVFFAGTNHLSQNLFRKAWAKKNQHLSNMMLVDHIHKVVVVLKLGLGFDAHSQGPRSAFHPRPSSEAHPPGGCPNDNVSYDNQTGPIFPAHRQYCSTFHKTPWSHPYLERSFRRESGCSNAQPASLFCESNHVTKGF